MAEEMDLSAAADKLREMLGSDDGKQQLGDIISMLGGNIGKEASSPSSASSTGETNFDFSDAETLMKLQKVMSAVSDTETTKQARFLKSLASLLKPEKRNTVNNAVKFISIGKAIEIFKDM